MHNDVTPGRDVAKQNVSCDAFLVSAEQIDRRLRDKKKRNHDVTFYPEILLSEEESTESAVLLESSSISNANMLRSRNTSTPFLLLIFCLIQIYYLDVSVGESPTKKEDSCNKLSNKSCDDCVKVDGCAFCEPTKECMTFALVKDTVSKSCKDQDWKYKQCVVSGKVLLIALPVTGFVVLVALGCCIYWCCCRRKKSRGPSKEEAKWRRQREEIEIKHKERRAERQKKHDDIRKKYGLYRKDDSEEPEDGRYHRFDNAAVA